MKMNQQNQTSNQSLAQILATNQSTQNLYEHWNNIDCMGTGAVTQAILPPPLFDTNCTSNGNYNQCYEIQNHPGNYCTLSAIEMPKMPSRDSSKRLHRTIPKHFTMSSPSSSTILANGNEVMAHGGGGHLGRTNSGDNKKPSCQCPVQHVPMTYMQFSSAQVAQMQPPQQQMSAENQAQSTMQQQPIQIQQRHHQHSIYMSSSVSGATNGSISGSSGGKKNNNVIKSTTYPSAMNVQNVSGGGKIQTIANSELLSIGTDVLQSTSGTHSIDMNSSGGLIASGSGTLRRSHKSSSSSSSNNPNNNLAMPTTPNKKSIATISVSSPRSPSSSNAAAQHGYFTPSKMDNAKPQQIHSILKNKNQQQQPNCHINVISVNSDGCIESPNNPILPPKLYKNNNGKYSITPGSGAMTPSGSKQIHTITRPNELTTSSSQFTLLSINGGAAAQKQQQQYQQQSPQYQPTQLRTNIQVRALKF